MEELKRMLEAIHKENKDIMFLLCIDGEEQTDEVYDELADEINKIYDGLFYGKDDEEDERVED